MGEKKKESRRYRVFLCLTTEERSRLEYVAHSWGEPMIVVLRTLIDREHKKLQGKT